MFVGGLAVSHLLPALPNWIVLMSALVPSCLLLYCSFVYNRHLYREFSGVRLGKQYILNLCVASAVMIVVQVASRSIRWMLGE